MKTIIFSIGLLCWAAMSWGQPRAEKLLSTLAKPGSSIEWLEVRPEVNVTAWEFIEMIRPALGQKSAGEWVVRSQRTDQLGMTHLRLQQYAWGVPVRGAEYMVHERDGRVYLANGVIVGELPAPSPGWIPEASALKRALEAIPSKHYLWQDERATYELRKRTGVADTSFVPVGRLMWERIEPTQDYDAKNLRLCWVVDVYTADGQSATVIIDAYSGELLRKIPLDIHCDTGTGNTTWNGTVDVNTRKVGSNYILHDDCQTPNIHVFNANDSVDLSFATEYMDADNVWTNTSAVQTYFGLRQSWQYFLTQHGRDSYNDAGAHINAYNEAAFMDSNGNKNGKNASWNSGAQVLRFGDNDTPTPNDDWNTVDIAGHEFTHAVTQFSAGLQYAGESGALNESFSDIFGEMVELFTEGNVDWLVGGDRGAIRSMSNPKLFADPDTYLGSNWRPTHPDSSDNGGVHTNSGVQNFWFYLLSEGGSGFNDNGDYYEVVGIGPVAAAQIAYRNLTTYLGTTSDYAAAKNGAIQAAEDLFGPCSFEVFQTARAWQAVGLYTSDALGYDLDIDCAGLDFLHGFNIVYTATALNDIFSDCNITPNGTLVNFEAGHHIVLRPGFASGDNFHAYITPCGSSSGSVSGAIIGARSLPGTHPKTEATMVAKLFCSAFPIPFSTRFKLQYDLPADAEVSAVLFDQRGRLVRTLIDTELQSEGYHVFEFETGNLDDGVYYLELLTPAEKQTIKLVKLGQ